MFDTWTGRRRDWGLTQRSVALYEGEQEIATMRPHWLVVTPPIILGVAAVVFGAILLGALPDSVLGVPVTDYHSILRFLIVATIVGCEVLVVVRLVQWRFISSTLTNHRIVYARGVIFRTSESVSLDHVQDIIVHQNIVERLLGCADIAIQSAGRDGTESLTLISRSRTLYDDLENAIEKRRAIPIEVLEPLIREHQDTLPMPRNGV
jgi:uncharacterized membrane protein YdbT with pleckstrin-like domain